MKSVVLSFSLGVLLASPLAAQEPQPAPPPCPRTGGVQIGQNRAEAFKMMAFPDTKETFVLHAPPGRPYKAEVTFSSAAPEGTIVALHYIFNPGAKLRESLEEKFGKATTVADKMNATWDVARCGIRIRYLKRAGNKPGTFKEEMWIDPLG